MKKFLTGLVLVGITFHGCGSYNDVEHIPSIVGDIQDNDAWYQEMPQTLLETSVTIPVPNEFQCKPWNDLNATLRPCRFDDVWNDTDANDDYEPILHVHYENAEFPAVGINAEFKQKGKTTRHAKQKSFRIKLDSKTDLFYGERTMQLNKHPYDKTRMRNKLFFEIFQDIPNLNSLRTRFVHLTINDDGNVTDQGLFTHIEKGDKYYLINRGYSLDDNLYKAQNFAFRMQDELQLDEKGKPLDPDAFNSVMTISNGKDTYKFIEMLNAIDAARTDEEFTKMFNRYFNRQNYLTWMAVNIVSGNKDTVSQNFFLINPKHSDVFYFTPWDYDGAARAPEKYAKWEFGVGTWWSIPLHKKFLRIKKNRDDLDVMVYNIRNNYMSDAIIAQKMDYFRTIVEPFMQTSPDGDHLSHSKWEAEFNILRDQRIAQNIWEYESEKGMPMPFWQSATYKNGTLHLTWDESIDFENDEILYNLQVTDYNDINFTHPFIDEYNISKEDPRVIYESWGNFIYDANITLQSGQHYYMKVVSFEKDNPAHYQIAFDKEVEVDDVKHFGVLEFKVD